MERVESSSQIEVRSRTAPYASIRVGAHRVDLLRDGGQTYAAMLAAIRAAQSTILLETYILRDDGTGTRFAEALCERARAGVEVNLLYDAWGSDLGEDFLATLHDAGVRTLAYHPLRFTGRIASFVAKVWRRDHRKILVVDSRVGFTGGTNIADDYAAEEDGGQGWRDTHVRIEGPAVAELQYRFLVAWRRHKGAPVDERRYRGGGRRPEPRIRVVSSSAPGQRRAISAAYRKAIGQAKQRVCITNAYFLPTLRVLQALRHAAKRGVDVRVIVAGTTDVPAVRFASRAMYDAFLHAGVRIFEWKGRVLHAKTATVDGWWSTVGSSNLDTLSLRVNLEANVVIEDRAFAGAMERMFDEDLAHCEEITLEKWHARPLWERVLGAFALLFRRWL